MAEERLRSTKLPQTLSADRQIAVAAQLVLMVNKPLTALFQEGTLKLLTTFETNPFTNIEAREVLGLKRGMTWVKLSELVDLKLLEKRGNAYRVSPFSRDLILALADTFSSLTQGTELSRDPEYLSILKIASEGIELLYSRGKVRREDYFRYKARIQQWGASQ